jgi:hypothetical protein
MVTLREILWQVIQKVQQVEGGHNGPWRNPATPVRNSAHWLITTAWAYEQTGNDSYLHRVVQLAEYLISREARPAGYAFMCFTSHPSSRANGLIGQAWVIEALIRATETTGDSRYLQTAREVWLQHAFEEGSGLWHGLEPDGVVQPVHPTLNQQVWFAAMGTRLVTPAHPEIQHRIKRFMQQVEQHIKLYPSGLLGMHTATADKGRSRWQEARLRLRWWLRRWLRPVCSHPYFDDRTCSVGYHAFTLYGFGLLRESMPDHPFWQSTKLQKALQWSCSTAYKRALRRNPFAMGYNPVGFEMPYVLTVFPVLEPSQRIEEAQWWLQEQVRRHFNPVTGRFDRNTPDAATLTSRIYEATRLPPMMLDTPLDI